MANNRFTDAQNQITEDDIREVEASLNVVIPPEVRNHYLEQNGGVPEHPCWDLNDVQHCISEFLPIKHPLDDGRTLESTYQNGIKKDFLVPGMVPFAIDWGGNYFTFDERGSVYFYAMDAWTGRLTPEENKKKATKLLSRSFRTFIEKLVPDENP